MATEVLRIALGASFDHSGVLMESCWVLFCNQDFQTANVLAMSKRYQKVECQTPASAKCKNTRLSQVS